MADIDRGKSLFDSRVEHPLPPKPGVADYVFYVPTDGYAAQARTFFNKFYPHHRPFQAPSLEDLVSTLHDQITNHGVTQIREIVIVSHGNTLALKFPLLGGAGEPNLKELSVDSLVCLQMRMKLGDFAAFQTKRAVVVAKLTTESWITIRACRFGTCRPAMFGLYAFFGGRAEVYAPTMYQFFGYQVIPDPAVADAAPMGTYRLPTLLAAHAHLVRQHLRGPQTPERQDATVKALLDPATFSEPFELARSPANQPASATFTDTRQALSQVHPNDALKARFSEGGFDLSDTARILTSRAGWAISDTVKDSVLGESFPLTYSISLDTEAPSGDKVLKAQSHLARVGAAERRLPTQLFITEAERRLYDGWVFELSVTQDGQQPTDPAVTRYNAIVALLKSNGASGTTLTNGAGLDLRQEFRAGGAPLADTPPPTVKLLSNGPQDIFEWWSWSIGDYVIKHEHPNVADDATKRVHLLRVYQNRTPAQLRAWQSDLFAYAGFDLDLPGVELAAYLDRLSIDDLIDVITYLRTPYRPAHAFYIWHAQQAITRKGNFLAWQTARYPSPSDPSSAPIDGLTDPLVTLSEAEREDRNLASYDLDFNTSWGQAKVTARTPITFQNDLFLDEHGSSITARFGIPAGSICQGGSVMIQEDSPSLQPEDLDDLRRRGLSKHLSINVSKDTYTLLDGDPSPKADLNKISCPDFRTAAAQIKTVIGSSADQIAAALSGKKTPDGSSYYDLFKKIWGLYSDAKTPYDMLRTVGDFQDFLPDNKIPGDRYELTKAAVKFVSKRVGWKLIAEIVEGVGEVDLAITVPFEMLMHIWEDEAQGAANFKLVGRLVAVRQYLQQLSALTFTQPINSPADVTIDMQALYTRGLDRPYFLEIYLTDEWERHPGLPNLQVTVFSTDLHQGVDEGIQAGEAAVPQLLDIVRDATGDLLASAGFDACKVQALKDLDLVNIDNLRGLVLRELVRVLLARLEPGGRP